MVRGVFGDTDSGGICDPDSGQPSQEPAQPAAVDKRTSRRCFRDSPAIHATREIAALYAAALIIAGCDCLSCGDLSLSRAGCKILVLSQTRAYLKVPVDTNRGNAC